MARPLIMVAPNGARRGRADHPALPVTLRRIVETAATCHAAGADALHLHVRDAEGRHSLDAGLYRETLAEISRAAPDLRLQITTEAAGIFDVPAQLACLERVRPAWASIAAREIARDPDLAPRVYALCADMGIETQHILYDTGDVALLARWRAEGIVRPKQDSVLYVLGRYATGQVSDPGDLDPFLAADPDRDDWMVCAFGPAEHACLARAARLGGKLRVGFENSLTRSDGAPHRDNAASVADLLSLIEGQCQ
ncbi:3-keto-5-aminohexanoate cleavage protein [Amaricoccus solimangrovi]|uniref:3-keto-5-aminohexanoate cleavage protein n=1 Tax=Amaricoccus solimangrovi TaxID=2589815 RepID=A0A501WUB8_9RHOB|nr:3-keto-5-aminohexanoate cleavage protein [Amaricoccus solimangrovi]TPE51925.1 3-keto-5-aminohexanoate cleavage protein [Amaricoccus solimangrovi]